MLDENGKAEVCLLNDDTQIIFLIVEEKYKLFITKCGVIEKDIIKVGFYQDLDRIQNL